MSACILLLKDNTIQLTANTIQLIVAFFLVYFFSEQVAAQGNTQ